MDEGSFVETGHHRPSAEDLRLRAPSRCFLPLRARDDALATALVAVGPTKDARASQPALP
jgi:hypothetical protein